MAQLTPDEIEFGHVCENPDEWEQRFEKINLAEHKHQGKVFKTKINRLLLPLSKNDLCLFIFACLLTQ